MIPPRVIAWLCATWVVTVAGCVADNYVKSQTPINATAVCVQTVWTIADRVACLQAGKP